MSDIPSWARKTVERIEQSIQHLNKRFPRFPRAVVWGHPSVDEKTMDEKLPSDFQTVYGLIDDNTMDYSVEIRKLGSDVICAFSATMRESRPLPLTCPELFNLLWSCEDAVNLVTGADVEAEEIVVFGVQTQLYSDGITYRSLDWCLSQLNMSLQTVTGMLLNGEGHDHWGDCGISPDPKS